MELRELRQQRELTLRQLSKEILIEEKRLKIIERKLDSPNKAELNAIRAFFELKRVKVNHFAKPEVLEIGEGYVTAINEEFKALEPQIARQENKPAVLDLFCGIGGLSYGFEQTGFFSTIGGLDLLQDRIKTFQRNHQHSWGFSFDINKIDPKKVLQYIDRKPDIVVGGAPCQGFSSIRPFRTLSEDDSRNNLFKAFAKYLTHFKPTWFVFENVVGLLTHKNGDSLRVLIKEFEQIGYQVDFKILNAAFFGVPQLRERLIIVGNRKRIKFEWPIPTHYYSYKSMAGNNNTRVLKPENPKDCLSAVTTMDALSDLPPLTNGGSANVYLSNVRLNAYQEYLRDNCNGLTHHSATYHSDEMMNIIRHSGYNIDSVRHLVTSGFSSCYSRLEPDRPSVTLTVNFVNPSSNKCIHPIHNRALTPREGARLQGFPDKFDFEGTRTQIVKQIGNAVPPILSKVIAEKIKSYY